MTPDQAARACALDVPGRCCGSASWSIPTTRCWRPISGPRVCHVVQFHGHETPARVAAVRERFGVKAMKVIRVAGPEDLADVPAYRAGRRPADVRRQAAARRDPPRRQRRCLRLAHPVRSHLEASVDAVWRARCRQRGRRRWGSPAPVRSTSPAASRTARASRTREDSAVPGDRSRPALRLGDHCDWRRNRACSAPSHDADGAWNRSTPIAADPTRHGPFRHVRRPLRRRNADAADPRAREGLARGATATPASRPSSTTGPSTMSAGPARSISPSG